MFARVRCRTAPVGVLGDSLACCIYIAGSSGTKTQDDLSAADLPAVSQIHTPKDAVARPNDVLNDLPHDEQQVALLHCGEQSTLLSGKPSALAADG